MLYNTSGVGRTHYILPQIISYFVACTFIYREGPILYR
jgi:hypothetical protein